MAAHPRPLPVVTQAIRLAWESEARRAGLRPVASYWRWVALMRKKPVSWLRKPWKDDA